MIARGSPYGYLHFVINIITAQEIATHLIKDGKVFTTCLGLMLQEISLNPKIVRHYQLPTSRGLFVVGTEDNSPASSPQLEEGDILVRFNKQPVNSTDDLLRQPHQR